MPSQFFGLTIAASGLSAYQASLNTTANNIANEQTVGYSRQVANLSASNALRVNAKYGSMGAGVQTESIKQIRSEYYDSKYWQNQSSLGMYETKLSYLEQIENYFDDDGTIGFASALNKMFNALDSLKGSPSDLTVRESFVSTAQNFANYFNSVATGLGQLQDSVNEEIKSTVQEVNAIGKKIALLNQQINVLEGQGGYANELRDQRALLIDELSAIVPTEVEEIPITNSNYPDMPIGTNYYIVKINGQNFVDTDSYRELTCVARDNKIYQSDKDGMYDVRWADTGSSLHAGSSSSSGSLKALFDIRDGNNNENFKGTIQTVTSTTITVKNPSITNINAMTMPHQGVVTIDNQTFNYKNFSFTTDADGEIVSYEFELEKPLSLDQQQRIGGKKVEVGESVDAMGIPYYMAQMNEFLRNFAAEFNSVINDGEDLNGDRTDYYSFFTGSHEQSGEELLFGQISPNTTYRAYDEQNPNNGTYYRLTCSNVKISTTAVKDPSKLATNKSIGDGVDNSTLIDELLKLKSDVELYRGGGADDFLQCILSDITVDTQKSDLFYDNYNNISSALDQQRMSVSGVDQDEEAMDLVKFQNAYNLSSKMVSVLAEVYDKLIQETGV